LASSEPRAERAESRRTTRRARHRLAHTRVLRVLRVLRAERPEVGGLAGSPAHLGAPPRSQSGFTPNRGDGRLARPGPPGPAVGSGRMCPRSASSRDRLVRGRWPCRTELGPAPHVKQSRTENSARPGPLQPPAGRALRLADDGVATPPRPVAMRSWAIRYGDHASAALPCVSTDISDASEPAECAEPFPTVSRQCSPRPSTSPSRPHSFAPHSPLVRTARPRCPSSRSTSRLERGEHLHRLGRQTVRPGAVKRGSRGRLQQPPDRGHIRHLLRARPTQGAADLAAAHPCPSGTDQPYRASSPRPLATRLPSRPRTAVRLDRDAATAQLRPVRGRTGFLPLRRITRTRSPEYPDSQMPRLGCPSRVPAHHHIERVGLGRGHQRPLPVAHHHLHDALRGGVGHRPATGASRS
jgi:hypothetical protein